MTWGEAVDARRAVKSELTSVENEDENVFLGGSCFLCTIPAELQPHTAAGFWIGLRRSSPRNFFLVDPSVFFWMDGEELGNGFQNWAETGYRLACLHSGSRMDEHRQIQLHHRDEFVQGVVDEHPVGECQ